MSDAPATPYIGPRAFAPAETALFFGREREVDELFNRLIAQRLVLLHAPSGAGKTSLINAALLPRLADEGFRINDTIRVGEPPATATVGNRFVAATARALDVALPNDQPLPSLVALLASRPAFEGEELFIFDQFEEVLTVEPKNRAAKEQFFRELGAALENRRRWALFALREDYLGALRPFTRFLPTRLSGVFRLDLLSRAQAREAIQGPARTAGIEFTAAAAERLANDLSRTIAHGTEGIVEADGPYVEPVQLQVVCLRLWEQLYGGAPPDRPITEDDVAQVGDVNVALAEYYSERVQAVAAATGVTERLIRLWFDEKLITEEGRRDLVMREADESGGLADAAVKGLIDAHLVRAEERRDTTWLELAHDRLIEPILENNRAWDEHTLTPFQRQAALWEQQGRPADLLLQGDLLREAEEWAKRNADTLITRERLFLEQCVTARGVREREQRYIRQLRRRLYFVISAAAVAVVLAIAAFVLYQSAEAERARAEEARTQAEEARAQAEAAQAVAESERLRAENERRNAEVRQFAALSLAERERLPQSSLLTAFEGVALALPDDPAAPTAQEALRAALASSGGIPLRSHTLAVNVVAFSPRGDLLATAGEDTTVRIWRVAAPGVQPAVLAGHGDAVVVLTFSSDGTRLASAGLDGSVRIWRPYDPAAPAVVLRGHGLTVTAIAFSPSGDRIVTGSQDGTMRLWSTTDPADSQQIFDGADGSEVRAVAFSPDGRWIAAAGKVMPASAPSDAAAAPAPASPATPATPITDTSAVYIWSATDPAQPPQVRRGHTEAVTSLAFSPDGELLASASLDATVQLWTVADPAAEPTTLEGLTATVTDVTFSRDGTLVAAGSTDTTARIWRLDNLAAPLAVLLGHTGAVTDIAFSPDGQLLATAGQDRVARLWATTQSAGPIAVFIGHGGPVNSVAFSPDGRLLATGSADYDARLWWAGAPAASPQRFGGHSRAVSAVAYSPDGRWVASASFDGTARLWPLEPPGAPAAVLEGHLQAVRTVAFSPDSSLLATGGDDNRVRIWSVASPDRPLAVLREDVADVISVAFSADGRWLVSTSSSGEARLWFASALEESARPIRVGQDMPVLRALFVPGRDRLAVWGADGSLKLWNLSAMNELPTLLSTEPPEITAVAASPNGRWLASAGADGVIRLWRVDAPGAPPAELRGHSRPAYGLAFSPDSALLASASNDTTVKVWRVDAPDTPLADLQEHDEGVQAVAFSPLGDRLVTASIDRTARLYEVATLGRAPVTLRGHDDAVVAIAFSPDGRRLLTGGNDRSALLWQTEPADLRALACLTAARNLSTREYAQLFGPEAAYRATCPELARPESYYQGLVAAGQLERAITDYEADHRRDPSLPPPAAWLVGVATRALGQEQVDQAADILAQAKERDPTLAGVSALTFNRICLSRISRETLALNLEGCDRALAIDPDNANFHYNRAFVLAAMGHLDEASADLRAFINLAQGYRDPYQHLLSAEGWIEQMRQGILPPELALPGQ